jgi:hypothetical protein
VYAVSVTKFVKSVYPFWNVVPLGGDPLFGHSSIGIALSSKAALTTALVVILRVGAPTIDYFFLLLPLPLSMALSIRPRGFAFRRTRHCIFEKIKLGGQLAVLECLFFSAALDIIIRSSLLEFKRMKLTELSEAHLE